MRVRLTFCQKLIIVCVDMSAPHTLILEAARTIVELFRKKKISRHIWRVGQIKKQGDKSVILFVKNENRKTAFVANMNMGLVFHDPDVDDLRRIYTWLQKNHTIMSINDIEEI